MQELYPQCQAIYRETIHAEGMINGPCLRNMKNKYNRNNAVRFEQNKIKPRE